MVTMSTVSQTKNLLKMLALASGATVANPGRSSDYYVVAAPEQAQRSYLSDPLLV
jgi:hypothetical protein